MNVMDQNDPNYVDARGLICPQPVLLASQRMKLLSPGEQLTIQVTDPHAELDFEVFCNRHGHQITESWVDGETWWFTIQKVQPHNQA